jgi:tRNA nucleotidyltransferase (CCA-adding enzyme)
VHGKQVETGFRKVVPPEVHEVLRTAGVLAQDMGASAFLVGGMVRDVAAGRPNIDLDIVIEGDALAFADAFAERTGSSVRGRTKFGTCKVEGGTFGSIDVAMARSETYRRPGALPDVAASNLEADLARRDFTVNAMAISLDPGTYGRLLDPFRGLADMSLGRLRIMHPDSFRDDPTRILRGIRFASRFGFAFERRTLARLKICLREGCMGTVSGKRVYTEIGLTCKEGGVLRAFKMLEKYGILESIDPALARNPVRPRHWKRLARTIGALDGPAGEVWGEKWLCWLASLFVGLTERDAARLAGRLDLPGRVRGTCLWAASGLPIAVAGLSGLQATDAYRVVRLLRGIEREEMVLLFAASRPKGRELISTYMKTWRHVSPGLDGRRIISLGVERGPLVGRILERLLELRLLGRLASTEDEIEYVKRRVRSSK